MEEKKPRRITRLFTRAKTWFKEERKKSKKVRDIENEAYMREKAKSAKVYGKLKAQDEYKEKLKRRKEKGKPNEFFEGGKSRW